MNDILKQRLDELKGKRVKNYTLLSYPLDMARLNEEIFIAGSYLYVLSLDGTAKIKLNEVSGDDIDLFKYRQISSPFYRLFVTHVAQATKTLVLAVGVSSEVFSIQDFQSPDLSLLLGYAFDLRNSFAYNYGTQIAKSNSSSGMATVILHTVTAGKTLLLENWSHSAFTDYGKLFVRDAFDVLQYYLLWTFASPAVGIQCQHGLIAIPEGYDICFEATSYSYAEIKGREI